MKVKDLLERLKDVDPETVISGISYLDILPYYYDGYTEDISLNDDGSVEITLSRRNKIYFRYYSLEDLAHELDGNYEEAMKHVHFEGELEQKVKDRTLKDLEKYCVNWKKIMETNNE